MSWIKPQRDRMVKDVQHVLKTGGLPLAQIQRKTGLCISTLQKMRDGKTKNPHPTTLSFILRAYDKELVIRDRGSNR